MNKATSPFNFLDAYSRKDADIWFGRKKETEALYDALSGVKHLLVYGPSGSGKTSLVECGLRNQFSDADWFALTIRRGNNMSTSVYKEINTVLKNKMDIDAATSRPKDENLTFGNAVEKLFEERHQPVYLLFDQFEELLLLGKTHEEEDKDEKKVFFKQLNQLLRYKVPCRIILIMREEFIGHLSEYEYLCPSIFQHRFRLEKMRKDNVTEVILKTLSADRFKSEFKIHQVEALAEGIFAKLPDNRQEIELAHVQVFLDELWDRANQKLGSNTTLPVISQDLIRAEDNLSTILDSFLKKQVKELEETYPEKMPLEVLTAMITNRHTKLQLSEEELRHDLAEKGLPVEFPLLELLNDFKERRVIRTLKSGESPKFEISHDQLALVVGQNLTADMKNRERAGELYRSFKDKKGFLSQEDIDLLAPFKVPEDLQQRIIESKKNIKNKAQEKLKEAQTRLNKERIMSFIIFFVIIIAGAFIWRSEIQKQELTLEKQEQLLESLRMVYTSEISRLEQEKKIASQKEALYELYKANDLKELELKNIDSLNSNLESVKAEIEKIKKPKK